jgi:hypothetical protein
MKEKKMKELKKTLKKIREERKKIEQEELKEINKVKKRSIELVEFEDGTYLLSNSPLWNLPLEKDEVQDAFESWFDGSLENGKALEQEI